MDLSLRMDDLPLPVATRCLLIEATCKWLDTQVSPTNCLAQAAVELTAKLAAQPGAAGRGVSEPTLRRLWYRWKNAGRRWQALLDGRSAALNARGAATACPAFKAHLALLASRHKRCLKSAILDLYAEWREGKRIPGYEGQNYKKDMPLPAGWSEDNLRRLMPAPRALKVMREGVRAASAMLPQVFATRAGCWPCSHVMFDDVWLDVLALGYDERGKMQLGRPLQLGCLDMYTGKRLSWGTKIRTKAEDGHSLQLNGDEMLYLLCDYLSTVGYSTRGTVLVVEHGTAAIDKDVEDMLGMLSNGLIRVERSGISGVRQVGAFGGRGVGNPRFKAELEVWHSLLHNRMDGELTQVGKDRTEPEALHGIRKATEALIKAGQELSTEQSLLLAPYVPTLAELCDKLVQVVGGINARTDHELEGWAACGFTGLEFSMTCSEPWTPLDALKPEVAAMAKLMAAQHPAMLRQRKLSPNEAWERATREPGNELIRFTPAQCVALMGAHRKFKLTAKGGAFKLDSRARHHEQLMFETRVRDARGNLFELPAGQTYYGIFNPLSEGLFVLDEKGVVLGAAQLINRFAHVDEAAKLREFGKVQHRRAEQLAEIAGWVAPDTADLQNTIAYNADVRQGRRVDPLGLVDRDTLQKPARRRRPEPARLAYVPTDESSLPEDYEDGGTFTL